MQYEQFNFTQLPALTKTVFVAFAVLVPILLINMLIAMMGNTYEQIIRRSEKEWKRQVRQLFRYYPCGRVTLERGALTLQYLGEGQNASP